MKSFFLLSLLLASSVGQLQILPPILGDGSFSLFDNLLSNLVIQNNGRHNIFANGTLTGILSLTIGSATSIPTIIVTPNSVLSVVGDLVINNGGIVLESGASLIANNIKITADNTQIVINEASNVVASILSVGQGVHATFSGAGSISVNSSVVVEAGASLNYDVDVSFAAGTIFDVAADGVQQFLGDVKNIAANDLNIAGNVILQAGSSVSGVKNVIFDGIVDIQSTVDKAVEFTTGVVFQKATTIEGLVNSVSSVAFQEAATLGSSAIAQLKNVIASANFTLQSGASLVIQELETTVKAVYFDVASNANVLLTSGLSTIRSDLVSVGQGTFQIVDATVAAAFSDVNLLFSSNVQLGGTVNLGVDANGVAKVITQFTGVVHALNETVLNALAQFNAGSIITGSSNIGSAAAITFNAATLLSSSASVNGAISIQTKVMFAADATVDGTVQLANSATLGAQAWLLLRTKAVINGDTNANIFLNSGAILYASSDANVNLASGLSLSKNVTVQAAASATLTIGSNVNILASGTADARFIGAIVVSGDIKAAASSQIILSGTSTVVSSVNADLQTAAKLTMDATVNASAHIVASGQVSFGGSLEIRLCAQVNAQVNAQANGNVVIADYLARAGVFASLDVNLVAGCSDDAPSGVASKRDASGYSVHYTDKQAYASADNVNNNDSDVSSAQRVAFVGMMTLMLALFA